MSDENAAALIPPSPSTRGKRGKHVRLMALPSFDMIHDLLIRGLPLDKLARIVQEDWNEALDVSRSTLTRWLQQYREEIPTGERLALVAPQQYERVVEQARKFDVLDEYYKLYRKQEERIEFELDIERKYKKAIKTTHKEVREARMLLKDIASLQLEVGDMQRAAALPQQPQAQAAPGTLNELSERFGFDIEKVTGDPKSRQRVLVAVDRFRAILERNGDPLDGVAPQYSILDTESALGMSAPAPRPAIDVEPDEDD